MDAPPGGPRTSTAPTRPATGRAARWQTRAQNLLVFSFAIVPFTFVQNRVLGFQLSGWSWLLILAAVAPVVVTEPVPKPAVRLLLPYLLYLAWACVTLAWAPSFGEGLATLAQFAVPALVYLLAWRVPLGPDLLVRLRKVCLGALAIAALLAIAAQGGPYGTLGLQLSPRPMAISLVVLFVAATLHSTSWRFTLLVGGVSLAIAMATGSRMSSLVLLVMLLTSPSLGVHWRGRVAVAAASVVLVVLISQTTAFQQRFFFSERASLADLVTVSSNVNTAGRRELWPKLLEECAPTSVAGRGIGASALLSFELSRGTLDHPHNEYIRCYCDVGWIGSILVWAFFLAAGLRSWGGAAGARERALHGAAGQVVVALLIFAITDNPLSYTAHFMTPLAAILGFSDRALMEARRRGPGSTDGGARAAPGRRAQASPPLPAVGSPSR
jgi:O-Antigen ligase